MAEATRFGRARTEEAEEIDNGGGGRRRDVEQVEVGKGWGRGPLRPQDPTRSKAARSLRPPGSADRPWPRGPPPLGRVLLESGWWGSECCMARMSVTGWVP